MATKREIAKWISEQTDIPATKVQNIIQLFLDKIISELTITGRLEFRNFGVFQKQRRPAHYVIHPETGKKIKVPAKNYIRFKDGKKLEQEINKKKRGRRKKSGR